MTVDEGAPAELERESDRTDPDYVTYVPGHWDGSTDDGLNEHFLVVETPGGDLLAVWTQGSAAPGFTEERTTNRVVVARSEDGGQSWTEPARVAGPEGRDDPTPMASWAFPLVSDGGRIYLVYNQHQGSYSWIPMHCGTMAGVYSDDDGQTWSTPQEIPMPESPYDDPRGEVPPEWIAWQKPVRDLNGDWLVGYTHWVHDAVATRADLARKRDWTFIESVVEFARFTNVHDEPEPRDLAVCYSGWGEDALGVPHRTYPDLSVAQEPSIVRLPDDRLFVTLRTNTGCIWWSQSDDDGESWADPRPLRHRDHGRPIEHPVAPAPVYRLPDDRYLLLFHGNPGGKAAGATIDAHPRNPLYCSVGAFRPEADQPVWFGQPQVLMDTDGVAVDGITAEDDDKNRELPMYASVTTHGGEAVLWYPDRKCFLLGRRLADDLADAPEPPEASR
jgi:hypothetical protein